MEFDEFCAAALSVHQLEALDRWEQHARCAYELFEKDGNRAIVIEELASVCLIYYIDSLSIRICGSMYTDSNSTRLNDSDQLRDLAVSNYSSGTM